VGVETLAEIPPVGTLDVGEKVGTGVIAEAAAEAVIEELRHVPLLRVVEVGTVLLHRTREAQDDESWVFRCAREDAEKGGLCSGAWREKREYYGCCLLAD
jgi:transcriptional regulator GlxA family with amidase domain